MKSRKWEMPDGSAGHPLAHTSEGRGLRSKRVSADGISEQNLTDISAPDKLKLPAMGVISGLGAGLALTPDEAFGWGQATFLPKRRVIYPFIFTFV